MNVQTPDGRTLRVWIAGVEGGTPILAHHGTPGCGSAYGETTQDALCDTVELAREEDPLLARRTRG